jgi:hypothetical protein
VSILLDPELIHNVLKLIHTRKDLIETLRHDLTGHTTRRVVIYLQGFEQLPVLERIAAFAVSKPNTEREFK